MSLLKTKKYHITIAFLTLLILGGLVYWKTAYGVTRTWDGGGTDGTCGGAGTANNWSCAANWSADTAPTASDIATFDGTSTKNATINANISVAGIDINTGYTGTITQSGSYTVTVGSSHYDQADGTFTGGSGTIDVNGTFTLSGGTFTSTSGTLETDFLGADATVFTISGGTFNHNNGTVDFSPGNAGYDYTVDINTSLTLYDVVVSAHTGTGTSADLILASGDTIVAVNNFSHTDGRLNGTWEVQGNVTIGSGADSGGGTLTMTGTGSKTYSYSVGGVGPYLRVNNAALSVSAAGGTTNLSISSFALLAGTFTAPSGVLTIDATARSGDNTIFSVSSGTFNHNSGTTNFFFTVGSYTFTIDLDTTLALNNVGVNITHNGNARLAVASNDTLVMNHLTVTDGLLQGTWQVQGNTTIATTADGGTGTLAFTGGNDQTYTDQGGNEPDGDITINKSGGTVTLASNADWNAVNQDLTVTAGTLASSTYNLSTVNFTVNGGTFTGGSGTLTLTAGNFTLSSGAFTAPSGTFTLTGGGGAFSHSGGTFAHNNGTVVFGGSSVRAIDVPTSETFYNLGFDNNTNGWDIAAGDTLIVLGTLTHTNGTIVTGTVEVRGNVTVASTADGGTATLSFLVPGDQTITGNGGKTCGLNISKPSGTLSAGSTDLGVNGAFTLSSGTFVSTSGALTFNGSYNYTHTAGGTFVHNNGTVVFGGSGSRFIDVATSETFHNLGFDNNTNGWDVTAGDTLIVLGTLTQTNGYIGGAVEVQGNVTVATTADGGTGTLAFTGGNNQTYTDQGGNEPNGDITVNKSGGTLTLASTADWNAASQNLAVTSGTLFSPGYNLSTAALSVGASGILYLSGAQTLTLGGTLSNAGTVKVWGPGVCGGGDTALVRSSSLGVQRSWTGTGSFTVSDADIRDMAGTASITASSSTNTANNGANWTFSGASCATAPPAVNIGSGMLNIRSGIVNFR